MICEYEALVEHCVMVMVPNMRLEEGGESVAEHIILEVASLVVGYSCAGWVVGI